ncbi:triose-phosphate isomerase [Paracoccus marinaquae]|uniref:Triosephosphate isomerase n=1 Tax=Paracoccus marinaquae TaxID=2841926 RepID=A0ABS6AIA4_9RHOB|nr:triose-phosphate isomerase [Paracoccus marinaquae]MBU3029832.1 triose-phosphate isomerase [Paracoccus marinaquae]
MAPRKLAAGNWKMNGDLAALAEIDALAEAHPEPGCEVLICPPALLVHPMKGRVGAHAIAVGGQDCHARASGAHTGDISAAQLKDAGADYVILGHSERRADHGETDAMVAAKAAAAHAAGLVAVICVGETEAQRDAGETLAVIGAQLAGSIPAGATAANTVIAYEPVWAIGTGRTPTNDQIAEVHGFMRDQLGGRVGDSGNVRLLYGGSVKPGNAAEIFAIGDVDGALVGGASLKAADFSGIIAALEAAG